MITRQLQVERGTGKFAMCHATNLLTLTPWDRLSVVFLTEDHEQVAHSPDGRTDIFSLSTGVGCSVARRAASSLVHVLTYSGCSVLVLARQAQPLLERFREHSLTGSGQVGSRVEISDPVPFPVYATPSPISKRNTYEVRAAQTAGRSPSVRPLPKGLK